MTIRKATINDKNELIALRLDFLRMFNRDMTAGQEACIRTQMDGYLEKHLQIGDFVALLGEENGETVSCAFLSVYEKPANLAFLTGKTATVMNVMTYPQHREKGYAFQLLTALIGEARRLGITQIDLMATEAGKPLYEKLGFTLPKYTAMKLTFV